MKCLRVRRDGLFGIELCRSSGALGRWYEVAESNGVVKVTSRGDPPMDAPFPPIYMDLHDWQRLWNESLSRDGGEHNVRWPFGVYRSPDGGLWIDGSWLYGYGHYGRDDWIERVRAAQMSFPLAQIHMTPYTMAGWELTG